MPIRTKPFSEVTLRDVEDLIPREIQEDTTIEFKRQLDLETRDHKTEFLKDVSAMANAAGGTIIYGAVEGDGDERGQIVRIQGQALNRDETALQITNLLRDGLDERLDGVLFKALPTEHAGEYVCVLRIPASPLAPHRVKLHEKPQFYLRGQVSSAPMNTRQIREMILQRESAVDRALALVESRTPTEGPRGCAKRHRSLRGGALYQPGSGDPARHTALPRAGWVAARSGSPGTTSLCGRARGRYAFRSRALLGGRHV